MSRAMESSLTREERPKTRIEEDGSHRLRARKKAQGIAALGIPSFQPSERFERVFYRLQTVLFAAPALSTNQIARCR